MTALNVESIVRRRTLERLLAAHERTIVAPVMPSPTQIERLVATTVTSAREARNAALDRAVPGEMGEPPARRHATAALLATALAGPPAKVPPRTSRRGHCVPVIDAQHPSARLDLGVTLATTRTRVIADRACPRATGRPVERVRNVRAN